MSVILGLVHLPFLQKLQTNLLSPGQPPACSTGTTFGVAPVHLGFPSSIPQLGSKLVSLTEKVSFNRRNESIFYRCQPICMYIYVPYLKADLYLKGVQIGQFYLDSPWILQNYPTSLLKKWNFWFILLPSWIFQNFPKKLLRLGETKVKIDETIWAESQGKLFRKRLKCGLAFFLVVYFLLTLALVR